MNIDIKIIEKMPNIFCICLIQSGKKSVKVERFRDFTFHNFRKMKIKDVNKKAHEKTK